QGEFAVAVTTYKGSTKQFFQSLAKQLDIPIETTSFNEEGDDEGGKALTVDELKEEILSNLRDDTLILLPEAKRLPASVRYWFEDVIGQGAKLIAFSPINPMKDMFLELLEVELELPDDRTIRSVMQEEADRLGLQVTKGRLAELQTLAGRNQMIARKVIQRERLGMKQDRVEHTQYVVIMPVIVAALFSFAVVRFVGLGTGNRGLYITGGVCLVAAMALKQLGHVRGARKRLGQ
ncbi:hypothetical protein, partial [Phormidesmis sp. 146-33]